ncbi:hypothetical protein [Mesorhizobium sp. WSM3876]|uniref:hypothetical protein n=1 Tax=Mesorhizobium sp. WSM3876 TaxID=422277 RepID=UPI0015964905|nr:hypothetical protein [Mesorhizobium sp. WSM3876]
MSARAVFNKTIAAAKDKGTEVEVLARILAEKMQAIHGQEFQVLVDHQTAYVTVVRA